MTTRSGRPNSTQPPDDAVMATLGSLWRAWRGMTWTERLATLFALWVLWLAGHYLLWPWFLEGLLTRGTSGRTWALPPYTGLVEATGSVLWLVGGVGWAILRQQSARLQLAGQLAQAERARMMVILPPEGERLAWENMVPLLSGMMNLLAVPTRERWLGRAPHIALEWLNVEGVLHLCIWTPPEVDGANLMDTWREQLAAAYPNLQFRILAQERLRELAQTLKEGEMMGWQSLALAKPTHLPLLLDPPRGQFPMAAVLSALDVREGQGIRAVGCQLALRPAASTWRRAGERAVEQADATPAGATGRLQSRPGRRQAEAIQRKLDEGGGWEVALRLWACGGEAAVATRLRSVASAYRAFDGDNNLVVGQETGTDWEVLLTRRLPPFADASPVLTSREVALLFHPPTRDENAPGLEVAMAQRIAPSPFMVVPDGVQDYRGYTVIGSYDGGDGLPPRLVGVTDDEATRHFFCVGPSGSGKTVLLRNLYLQDVAAGRGAIFVDPHGDAVRQILLGMPAGRWQDVVILDPADPYRRPGLNPLEMGPNDSVDLVVDNVLSLIRLIMDSSWESAVRMQKILRNALKTLLLVSRKRGVQATLFDLRDLVLKPEMLQSYVDELDDPALAAAWQGFLELSDSERRKMTDPVDTRLSAILDNDIFRYVLGQRESTINFRQMMDEGRLVLCWFNKEKIGRQNTPIFAAITVAMIKHAAMSRITDIPDESKRRLFKLYIDEFPALQLPAEEIDSWLSEARKAKAALFIACQFMSQLDEQVRAAVVGNTNTSIFFNVGEDDAPNVVRAFGAPVTLFDATHVPKFHVYLLVRLGNGRGLIKTLPPSPNLYEDALLG